MSKLPRSLFAVLIRGEVNDATDMILDAIEKSGISDKDWDWLVWSRGTSVHAIISAPLLAKGAISCEADIRMLPVGSVSEKMLDNRNSWIYPRANAKETALAIAERHIADWIELQFIEDEMAKAAAELPVMTTVKKERTLIATRSQVYSRSQRKDIRTQQRGENTASALGLDTATDSLGRGFTFKTLG